MLTPLAKEANMSHVKDSGNSSLQNPVMINLTHANANTKLNNFQEIKKLNGFGTKKKLIKKNLLKTFLFVPIIFLQITLKTFGKCFNGRANNICIDANCLESLCVAQREERSHRTFLPMSVSNLTIEPCK